jgi:dipeptidase E
MKGRLFLAGGGNEKRSFGVDEIFLKEVSKILYVPLAWPGDNFGGCLKWFTSAMSMHKQIEIEMLTDPQKDVELQNQDAVYVGGGNTFKLLKSIREGGFGKKLLDYHNSGGTVYGGSAGALIWGADINIAKICADADANQVGLKDTSGFDALHGLDVQCHYLPDQLTKHQKYIRESGRSVVAIPEESALLLEDGRMMVIGSKPITLITKIWSREYDVNEEIKLADEKDFVS